MFEREHKQKIADGEGNAHYHFYSGDELAHYDWLEQKEENLDDRLEPQQYMKYSEERHREILRKRKELADQE